MAAISFNGTSNFKAIRIKLQLPPKSYALVTLPDLIHDLNYKDIFVFQIYLSQAFAVFSIIQARIAQLVANRLDT